MSDVADWTHGTDLRDENGYYRIPPGIALPKGAEALEGYPSVTTILDTITDFTYPERWWIASEVFEIARAAVSKQPFPVWHPGREELLEVMAGKILLNELDASFGTNAGKWWIAKAGGRELKRRGNRGTLIHDAVEDWLLRDMRVPWDDIPDYAVMLAEAREFALSPEYYVGPVRNAIAFCDRHLDPERFDLCECAAFNFEYGVAGTIDYIGPLRNTDKLLLTGAKTYDENILANAEEVRTGIVVKDGTKWMLDFKGSKGPKTSHRLQLAGYRKMTHALIRQFKRFEPLPQAERIGNVYVTHDYVHLKEWGAEDDAYTLEDSWAAFLHAAMLFFHFQREALHAPALLRSMSLKPPTREQFERYRAGGR